MEDEKGGGEEEEEEKGRGKRFVTDVKTTPPIERGSQNSWTFF
jgi:hypothetical protein